jgi:hypothetical protein
LENSLGQLFMAFERELLVGQQHNLRDIFLIPAVALSSNSNYNKTRILII